MHAHWHVHMHTHTETYDECLNISTFTSHTLTQSVRCTDRQTDSHTHTHTQESAEMVGGDRKTAAVVGLKQMGLQSSFSSKGWLSVTSFTRRWIIDMCSCVCVCMRACVRTCVWDRERKRERITDMFASLAQLPKVTLLLWQNFCSDKHVFAATNLCLLWQNTSFVVTKVYLPQQNFCCNKIKTKLCLLRQNLCHNKNDTCSNSHQWYVCMCVRELQMTGCRGGGGCVFDLYQWTPVSCRQQFSVKMLNSLF